MTGSENEEIRVLGQRMTAVESAQIRLEQSLNTQLSQLNENLSSSNKLQEQAMLNQAKFMQTVLDTNKEKDDRYERFSTRQSMFLYLFVAAVVLWATGVNMYQVRLRSSSISTGMVSDTGTN